MPPSATIIARPKWTAWEQTDANGFPYNVLHIFEPPRRRPLHRRYRYVVGADIGQAHDPTALAVGELQAPEIHLRHLARLPLGMP